MSIIQDVLENITSAYANPVVGGGKSHSFSAVDGTDSKRI